jgi:alpha-1,2-mannosyltransferase
MRTEGLRVLLVRAAYGLAALTAIGWAVLYLAVSAGNGTLGYDFRAYELAVDALLGGRSMYDLTATSMGAFGLFFYPPPFAVLALPVALLPSGLGVWVWTAGLVVASLAAIAVMPVAPRTRFVLLLLALFSWPLLYAIKLGQVGSLLLLLFAMGWRWLDRPSPFGIAVGLGTVIKLQPALVVGWALLTGRRRAAMVAVATFGALAIVATLVAGPQAWFDWLAVLGNVSRPVVAENDVGLGRLALLAGVPAETATLIHYGNMVAVLAVTAVAVLRASHEASYLAVVVASQFVSPVLWDHYALLLLLPVAWLVERGHYWSVLIPLATATLLAGITPAIAYPVLFWVALIAVTLVGLRAGRAAPALVSRPAG